MNAPSPPTTRERRGTWPAAGWHVLAAAAFTLLATLNTAGYRYGVGDQAFYVPSILRQLDGRLFPRDSALLDGQSRLFVFDELLARATGVIPASLETWFLGLYLLTLALLYAGLVRIADRLLVSRWSIAAFVAVATIRHRIAKTAANTLEGYFHPRQLAFAIGLLGLGEVLRGRPGCALAAAAVAGAIHPTTGIWFVGWIGVALVVEQPRLRPALGIGAAIGLAAGLGLLAAGFLPVAADGRRVAGDAGRQGLSVRDRLGRRAVGAERGVSRGDRGDLPGPPPARADAARRARAGRRLPGPDRRLRRDAAAGRDARRRRRAAPDLTCVLDGRRAGHARHRVVAGRSAPGGGQPGGGTGAATRPRWAFAAAAAFALGRGSYAMLVEHPERPLFALSAPADAWSDVSGYLRRDTPADTHVLADPNHALRFGTSLRVLAARDVFLENVKDEAMSMYDRRMAQRVAERRLALGDFEERTAGELQALGRRFDLAGRRVGARAGAARALPQPAVQGLSPHAVTTSTAPPPTTPREAFAPAAYVAHPRWTGGHWMTIYTWARRRRFARLPEPEARVFDVAPDARVLAHIHWQPARREAPTLLALHGLEGSSTAHYMVGLADKAFARGFNVVRLNQRNCGGTEALSAGLYHSGLTHDPLTVMRELAAAEGLTRFGVVGYSLGGNLTLKLAGEAGADPALAPWLRGVCAVSPTMDLARCVDALERRANAVYQWNFMRNLKSRMRRKAAAWPGRYDTAPLGGLRTVRGFDDAYTAPHHGFAGASDYYHRASALRVVDRIRVPALIVASDNDPFVPHEQFAAPEVTGNPHIRVLITRDGGHCGFLSVPGPDFDGYWAERTAVEFLAARSSEARASRAVAGPSRREGEPVQACQRLRRTPGPFPRPRA